jgi:hypothetical protein
MSVLDVAGFVHLNQGRAWDSRAQQAELVRESTGVKRDTIAPAKRGRINVMLYPRLPPLKCRPGHARPPCLDYVAVDTPIG